jgi:hypothetical protein
MNGENGIVGTSGENTGARDLSAGQSQEKAAGGATCPACGSAVAGGAKFCGNCGKPMARFCGNCGKPLPLGAKFCGECGTPAGGTAPQGGGNPTGPVLSAPGVEMSPGNIRFTPPDAGAAGSEDAAPPRISGNTPAERIRDYIQKVYNNTSCVVTGENLTPEFLDAGGLELQPGETPLLALKTWMNVTANLESFAKSKFGGFGGVTSFLKKAKMGTMMITDRRMVWVRLRSDTFGAGLPFTGTHNGEIALDAIQSANIGDHDHCCGTAYIGHQLVVNGKVVGLLRMGAGVVFDEETIDYLDNMFSACFKA